MHQLDHVSQDVLQERWNPRNYHGFADEDFIGIIKKIARKCHTDTIETRIAQRYLLRLKARW